MSIEWVMPSNHLILCRPLLLLPSIFPSIRVFSSESTLRVRWPKYWSFSFSISPSNEHPGLVSLRMDWLDLLAVQGTLKSLLQHYSSKASILQCSAFFIVQLSYPYPTSGKTVALTRRTFVGKIMSLLFNMLFLHPRFLKYLFVFICLFSFAVLAVACVTQFPDQGLNPGPRSPSHPRFKYCTFSQSSSFPESHLPCYAVSSPSFTLKYLLIIS